MGLHMHGKLSALVAARRSSSTLNGVAAPITLLSLQVAVCRRTTSLPSPVPFAACRTAMLPYSECIQEHHSRTRSASRCAYGYQAA